MRKCVSICLLLIILVSQYGHYCFYAFQEIQLKNEFKAKVISRLPESSLVKIIENNNIIWEEKGKEFFLDGELYDIVKSGISDGKKCYYVVNDHLEKKLVDEFNRILKSQDNNSKRGKFNLKFQPAVFTIVAESTIDNSSLLHKRTYFITETQIISLPKSINPHPPRSITV